jgi:tetratricopeptide (TPR) repeat protein
MRRPRFPLPSPLLAVTLLAGFAACAPTTRQVRFDPLSFTATTTPEGIKVDTLDPEVLFVEAAADFDADRHPDALRKFGLILEHFPDSRFARPARFNRGLTLLATQRPAAAADDFRAFIDDRPDAPDRAEALQRLGEALVEAGEWADARDALHARLAAGPVTRTDEIEARARLARSCRMLGMYREARIHVERVMTLHGRSPTAAEMVGNPFVAMAAFEGAATWHDLFAQIRFVLPTDRMEKDLTDKATLFLKAQAEYLGTMRLGNVFWAVQAGTRVGRMYEEFYDAILSAQTPPEFSPQELRTYLDELKMQARPLVAKAVAAYERNLTAARMYGANEEWFGDMTRRLERLKRILEEDAPSR